VGVRYLFLGLGLFFVVIWVFAFVLFHVAHFFMHLFLILAVIFFLVHLIRPRGVL
jgi:hypothetical protein